MKEGVVLSTFSLATVQRLLIQEWAAPDQARGTHSVTVYVFVSECCAIACTIATVCYCHVFSQFCVSWFDFFLLSFSSVFSRRRVFCTGFFPGGFLGKTHLNW